MSVVTNRLEVDLDFDAIEGALALAASVEAHEAGFKIPDTMKPEIVVLNENGTALDFKNAKVIWRRD